jgi:formate hydrogenlyase subunit 3/multisubunit Na+/H+ antiporter MnhD subunit
VTAPELGAAAAIAAIAAPLVLAAALIFPGLRPVVLRCAPWAAAPAFVLATGLLGTASIDWQLVLLGMRLGVTDAMTQTFLLLTSGVWLASSVFARAYMAADPRRARFWGCFLLTMTGNVGLVLAADVASFYCFYAVMTIASYGLVVHAQTREARRAGLIYLVMALLGEMVLLAACFLIMAPSINLALADVPGAIAASPHRDLIVVLVLGGFGVKAGALILHVWLPLAHPVAPTPASAVLSGAMIKAGLLAWLRFLPLGLVALPAPGLVCVAAGMTAAFYGITLGLCHRDPKTILAYSSVSQMGFMTATLGVALAVPEVAETAIAAIVFYAIHHAFAKSALFLGTAMASTSARGWSRRLVWLGLLVPALDLAGAPLSSGALAKLSIKDVIAAGPWAWAPLTMLLSIGAIGSTILMARFLTALARHAPASAARPNLGLWIPWSALLVIDLVIVVRSPVDTHPETLIVAEHVWSALWPVLAGSLVFLLAWFGRQRLQIRACIPPGDVVVVFEAIVRRLHGLLVALVSRTVRLLAGLEALGARLVPRDRLARTVDRWLQAGEACLGRFATIGLSFVLLAAAGLLTAWL